MGNVSCPGGLLYVFWEINKADDDHQQGAKAASKRERNAKDAKPAKSQLKVNESAKDIQCNICKSTFLKTTRAPAYVFTTLPPLSCIYSAILLYLALPHHTPLHLPIFMQ